MDSQIYLFLSLMCLHITCSQVNTNTDESQIRLVKTNEFKDPIEIVNSINDFGYKLLLHMSKYDSKNIVISPTSIAGLLAMTLLGSVGRSYDELAEALGFSQDILRNRNNHEQLGKLLEVLNYNTTSSQTLYADAIFVDTRSRLRDIFSCYLDRVYHGNAVNTDFAETDTVRDMINQWVHTHTNGKIKNFLKNKLPVDTKVVLLSALYFSGQWQQPFYPGGTKQMLFTKSTGEEVIADLMLNAGHFNHTFSIEDDIDILALPYNDSTTTLYAIKPRRLHMKLNEVLDKLDYQKIDKLTKNLSSKACVIRFPKMELESSLQLEKSLKALGVESVFIPGQANFALMIDSNKYVNKTEEELITRINIGAVKESRSLRDIVGGLPNPGVHVDAVLHNVKMSINEYGTEAAAVTAGIFARSAQMFYADSPFYMFIRNEKTGLVTFSAIVADPTA